MADGFGLPQRSRAPATTALTGFQFAMTCSHPGMCWVGTNALDTNVSGNSTMKPNEPADSGLLEFSPTQADDPRHRVGEEQQQAEPADDRDGVGTRAANRRPAR